MEHSRLKYQHIQEQFIAKCRGKKDIPEFAPSDRMQVYEGLIADKIFASLTRAYPIAHAIIDKKKWMKIISDFICNYDMKSPYYWRMPESFYHYAKEKKLARSLRIPYLEDLLWFEWIEIEVYMMKDVLKPAIKKEGNVLEDLLYMNPYHHFCLFSYPVFQKEATQKGQYHLIAYRHPETDDVHYLKLSSYYRAVLQVLSQASFTGIEVLSHIADLFSLEKNCDFFAQASAFLQNLLQLGLIEGFIHETDL